jgi:outer membrane receptor protein involved in Fe transport
MKRLFLAFLASAALAVSPARAQQAQTSPAAPPEQPPEDDVLKREETIVITASKTETTIINAPVTMSVITADTIMTAPSQNYGDILRSVPGINIIQTGARDFNITSRQGTSTLSNSQLALVDGRSIYLDFFGLILWDFVPTNPSDIKQIEVVRGPASAVWGANALTGVVNIVTKLPREATGGYLTLTGGLFSRDAGSRVGDDSGKTFGASGGWAAAPNDIWSYRVSAGYFNSDPWPRPVGTVPVGTHPANPQIRTGGGRYPTYENQGTSQPRFDLRVDQELATNSRITYAGGVSGSDGMIHTGIAPFDIQTGSYSSYGRVGFNRGRLRISGFANLFDAKAPNVLTLDAVTGRPLELNFKTQTYDLEAGHSTVVAQRHILTYGGNARRNNFEISIAPRAENRNEFGAYFQDEIFFDRFRFVLGGRVDKFGNLKDPVFSPRLTAMFKPAEAHAVRISYNRAFRSPSVINNYIDVPIKFAEFPLGLVNPAFGTRTFAVPTRTIGSEVARTINPGFVPLKEESLTAYEIGYMGTFAGRTTVGVSYYINDTDDNINFTTTGSAITAAGLPAFFTSSNPPPGWPLPPAVLDLLAATRGVRLPATFVYLNLGSVRNRGVELSLDHSFTGAISGFANYSWQDAPEPCQANVWESCKPGPNPFPTEELSFPATHRFNAGLSVNHRRWLGNVTVNYTSEAFWSDVLTADLHGRTDAYTLVGATLGLKWHDGKIVTSIKGTNLANDDVQQHIFGDIMKRSISGELRFLF